MSEHIRRVRRKPAREIVERHPHDSHAQSRCDLRRRASPALPWAFFFLPTAASHSGWMNHRLLKRASDDAGKNDFDGPRKPCGSFADPSRFVGRLPHLAEASEKQNRPETVGVARADRAICSRTLWRASSILLRRAPFRADRYARKALAMSRPRTGSGRLSVVAAGSRARRATTPKSKNISAAAVNKEPGNDLYQFNLAVSASSRAGKERRVAQGVGRLSKVAAFRAGRSALLSDAVQRNELERADTLAQDPPNEQEVPSPITFFCLELIEARPKRNSPRCSKVNQSPRAIR